MSNAQKACNASFITAKEKINIITKKEGMTMLAQVAYKLALCIKLQRNAFCVIRSHEIHLLLCL